MPDDRKRKGAKKPTGNGPSLPLNINVKEESSSSEDESDDSSKTVIRGEADCNRITQECENISPNCHQGIHQQNSDHNFIKAEDIGDDSSKSQKNVEVTQSDVYSHTSPSVEAVKKKHDILDTSCSTSILQKDSFRHSQKTEQTNESDKTMFNADHSSKIIHKKVKTEPVTFSSPAAAVEGNGFPIKPSLSPKPPNSLNHSQQSKDQNQSFPDSSAYIKNRIKKEPVFRERNKLIQHKDVCCPNNVMNSSMRSSADSENPSLKPILNLQSPLFDPNRKFSMDSARFLSNIDFTLEDITECINHISGKYLSGGNLEDISAPLNAFNNTSCVSIPNLKNAPISPCNKSELPENADHVSCINMLSTFETSSKDILKDLNCIRTETPFSKNLPLKLEENQMQSTSTTLSEEFTGFEDATKNLSATTKRCDLNESNYQEIQKKFKKSSISEKSNNFIDKSSSEFSFSNKKWNEILYSAGSILSGSPQSHEYATVTNDSLPVSSKDCPSLVEVGSKKKEFYEDFDISTFEKNNTFIETEIHKRTHLSKNNYSKEDSSLPDTARSENTELTGLHKLNNRNSSNSEETPVKGLKIIEYQNKFTKLQKPIPTLMEQKIQVIGNASTQSPVTNGSLLLSSKDSSQVEIGSKKRQIYDYSKDSSLPETARSENTELTGLHKLNNRNSSNSEETPVKRLKIIENQNKFTKLQKPIPTLVGQKIQVIGNASTQSPVTNDSLLSSKDSSQVEIGSNKRHVYEDFDISTFEKNNAFIKTKIHKRSHLSKNSYSKEVPSLLETARSENTESTELHKLNNRNLNDCGETPAKRLKTAEYLNKCSKLLTQTSTLMEQRGEVVGNTYTQSPLASCYSSFVPTSDRVRPSTSSVLDGCKQNVEQNQKSAKYSQNDAIPRDPRLHRNKSSIPTSVISPGSQAGTTGMVSPILSSSKQIVTKVDVQNHRSSHNTDTIQKSYHHHDNASRDQKDHRSNSQPSSYSHSHASTPSSSRLHSFQSIAHARKVETKVGKKALPVQDVSFHIIKWDTMWLDQMKENEIPQICKDTQPTQESYESFSEYYNTFCKLHLLSLFLDIYESWTEQSVSFCPKFESDEERSSHYKNLCSITVRTEDMPITQSIIHITRKTENCDQQCFFGFVYDVKQRTGESPSMRDVKFSFYTAERLWTKGKFELYFRKLSRVRIAIKQLSALQSFESSPMKNILLNPQKHYKGIEIFEIPSTANNIELSQFFGDIKKCAISSDNQFTLVVQPSDSDTLAIMMLFRLFLAQHSTVLVCLRDTKRCFHIAQGLKYGFVLALKESEISDIPENLKEFTLRAVASKNTHLSLEKAEMDVLAKAKLILTVTSRIFLGDNKSATLGPKKLTVIIEHSTMCTELETALPLSYRPENVVLLGDPKIFLNLHRHLNLRDYHKSLFHRLFEARKKT